VFERLHHQRIARVLDSFDGRLLVAHRCLFGGGTAMALRFGEYRESVDIDFLVSDLAGYRALRQRLTGPDGIAAIVRAGADAPEQSREVRADQYGVRTRLRIDGEEIKFELVLEGRIELAAPGPGDLVRQVATLTSLDMAASELLANSDRWRDDGVFSRDVIDLAMMSAPAALLRQAAAKAEAAYGADVRRDLAKAIEQLRTRTGWLERCMATMGMTLPRALLWQKVRSVGRALAS